MATYLDTHISHSFYEKNTSKNYVSCVPMCFKKGLRKYVLVVLDINTVG